MLHHDYGYTGSRYGLFIRYPGGRGVLVCLSLARAHLVKAVNGLTGNCLFLGEFFWSASLTGGLSRGKSGVFLLLFIAAGLVVFLLNRRLYQNYLWADYHFFHFLLV